MGSGGHTETSGKVEESSAGEGPGAGAAAWPNLSLPKGGGAIRGIGEKFSARAATGTGSMELPIATSPGRTGFGPALTLTYDSASGNSAFGFGWRLSVPAITRKTEKGLPRYRDREDSDVFILAGAEDLLPFMQGGVRHRRTSDDGHYDIERFRPRVEGAYMRIERWTRQDGDMHWRLHDANNVLTVLGGDARSRIADPADSKRVFSWFASESHDVKGNAIAFEYEPEGANCYLARILYGNRGSALDAQGLRPFHMDRAQLDAEGWLFETAFDYEQMRDDPFSSFRAGFEIRTSWLCSRVRMVHHFPDEPQVQADCLVHDLAFSHGDASGGEGPGYAFLLSAVQTHWRRNGAEFERASLPAVEFGYSACELHDIAHVMDAASLADLGADIDGRSALWVDLHGEGLPGVLMDAQGAWYYKANQGPLRLDRAPADAPPHLATARVVDAAPATALASVRFMDLAGDGLPDAVVLEQEAPGLFEHDGRAGFKPFKAFTSRVNADLAGPGARFVDLDGDGMADLLLTEDESFVWHASLAEGGFGPARRVTRALDEQKGPRTLLSRPGEAIHLADMTGDGLSDVVRVRNGEICYWPNLGHGRFGAKVTMQGAPRFDHHDQFDIARLRLADLDGSGTTDIVYLHRDAVHLYFNRSGNAWSPRRALRSPGRIERDARVSVTDLFGTGTSCLVWSSSLPDVAGRHVRYVDLMGGRKPHLLVSAKNNLGAETHIHYAPSTRFYLDDKLAGRPWSSRLPFPVQVVERVESVDKLGRSKFETRYAYHDGYFDGQEREFRGFGQVDQWDTETHWGLSQGHEAQLPVAHTRTWFHTGDVGLHETHSVAELGDSELPAGLSAREHREACRALKGSLLRQEIFGVATQTPLQAAAHRFRVVQLQPRFANMPAVFAVQPLESLTLHQEGRSGEPRRRHRLVLEVDAWGHVLHESTIAYGRRVADAALPADEQQDQARHLALVTTRSFAESAAGGAIDTQRDWRLPMPAESRDTQAVDLVLADGAERFTVQTLQTALAVASMREVTETRTVYRRDDLAAALAPGRIEALGLVFETYRLALSPACLDEGLSRLAIPLADTALITSGGYVDLDGDGRWWAPSGPSFLSPAAIQAPSDELAWARSHFFQPHRRRTPFHSPAMDTESHVDYDAYSLLPVRALDSMGSKVEASNDYRLLLPHQVTDANGNRTGAAFDILGAVAAIAVMGKPGSSEGDNLTGMQSEVSTNDLLSLYDADDPAALAAQLLGPATQRFIQDPDAYRREGSPACSIGIHREQHGVASRVRVQFTYADGFGRELQQKTPASPVTGGPRWICTGQVVMNSKGKVLRQVEPHHSDTQRFDNNAAAGAGSITFLDASERPVVTLHADHSWSKAVWNAWDKVDWDGHDTLLLAPLEDEEASPYLNCLRSQDVLPTWHVLRMDPALSVAAFADPEERTHQVDAARKAQAHAGTPHVTVFDAMGRAVASVTHNVNAAASAEIARTRTRIDIEGRTIQVIDAFGRSAASRVHDLMGRVVLDASADAGSHWSLVDAMDGPLASWDSLGAMRRFEHDALHRHVATWLQEAGQTAAKVEEITWGEALPDAKATNRRGRHALLRDQAGELASHAYDFKGNIVAKSRRLVAAHDQLVDWSQAPALENSTWESRFVYDAFDRAIQHVRPHVQGGPADVVQPLFDDAGLLARLNVWQQLAAAPQDLLDPSTATLQAIQSIGHNARGQREKITLGNGASTTYEHDPATFRLSGLVTTHGAKKLQDLSYVRDAVGNVTTLADATQQASYFNNQVVDANSAFSYDALYRLVQASGREHLGQAGAGAYTPDDVTRSQFAGNAAGLFAGANGAAMARYVEAYAYDALGNLLEMKHRGTQAAAPGWTRSYQYETGNNRLATSTVGALQEQFGGHYDAHGRLTAMPHLLDMQWDFAGRLRSTLRGNERTWYVYDSAGERVRKVTHLADGRIKESTTYLDGVELYRREGAQPLVRHTHHVMDDKQRVATVETVLQGNGAGDVALVRYPLGDELGSSRLELDAMGRIVSYEEYSPYGSTTFQAVRSQREAPRRYRYTGKERDEESGLYFHGARYYAPWLARWICPDPIGVQGERTNLYEYVSGNPIAFRDPDGQFEAKGVIDEVVKGGFHSGETTWTGTLLNIGVGLIPGVGQVADARDTVAAAKDMWNEPSWGNAALLGLATVGWIPAIGDAMKGAGKIRIKSIEAAGSPKVIKGTVGLISESTHPDYVALRRKLSALEDAQKTAKKVDVLPDGRIRYSRAERPAKNVGETRGSAYVTEWDPKSGRVRQWDEHHGHGGEVIRVSQKMQDGIKLPEKYFPPKSK